MTAFEKVVRAPPTGLAMCRPDRGSGRSLLTACMRNRASLPPASTAKVRIQRHYIDSDEINLFVFRIGMEKNDASTLRYSSLKASVKFGIGANLACPSLP